METEVVGDVTDWLDVKQRSPRKVARGKQGGGQSRSWSRWTGPRHFRWMFHQATKSVTDSKRDVYVTYEGRALRRSDELRGQVTSRMRGGGKHKDKRNKAEKKQAASPKRLQQTCAEEPNDKGPAIRECHKDAVIRLMEESEKNRKLLERMSEGSDAEVEKKMREHLPAVHEFSEWDHGRKEMMECGIRWAGEARRTGKSHGRRTNCREVERQECAFRRRGTARREANTEHRRTRRDERP